MLRTLAILAACALSIWLIPPYVGSYNYAIVGVCAGFMALLIVAYKATSELAPQMVVAVISLMTGVIVGVFWPAATATMFVWLIGEKRSDAGSGA